MSNLYPMGVLGVFGGKNSLTPQKYIFFAHETTGEGGFAP